MLHLPQDFQEEYLLQKYISDDNDEYLLKSSVHHMQMTADHRDTVLQLVSGIQSYQA